MNAKTVKPAAKKATQKKPAAKKASVTKLARKSPAKKIGASATLLKFVGAKNKLPPRPRFGVVIVNATGAPQLLPLQPPAFEPVHRTAAQWRSAARAVSSK